MQLFVRGETTQCVEVLPCCKVGKLRERCGLVDEDETIGECGLENESTIFVTGGLLGGGKKRKKKVYTKPKKNKRKPKKVKLAVLKFYKVDGDDKVQRLRKECPNQTCGPGVFMAMHFNRYYCGKCGLTYLITKGDDDK